MKHVAVAVAVAAVLPVAAASATQQRACTGWEFQVTHTTPLSTRERRMKRLIRCVFAENGIAGEVSTAYYVADRESGYAPWALNPSSGAAGLFQHIQSYWPGRARALPPHEFPRWPESSVFRARANAWAAARLVKASGWGAWTTA